MAYTGDLGTGGLSLLGDHGLRKDDAVRVSLSTPSSWEPLKLNARVCWTKPDSGGSAEAVGLMFVDLSLEETVALSNFVASLDYDS